MRYKLIKRLSHIGLNSISNLIGPITGILMSVIVIRFCSKELWGEVVGIMLWVGIVNHIASFGNKDYLLRTFSFNPSNVSINWSESLMSRFFILLLSIPFFLLLKISLNGFILISAIVFIRFIYQSYDPIIIYKRLFHLSIILETISFAIIGSCIIYFNKGLTLNKLLFLYAAIETFKTIALVYLLRKDFFPAINYRHFTKYYTLALPFFILNFTGMLSSKIDLICVNHYLSHEDIAYYQVLMNFLLIIQAVANFILVPFVKNIYRLKNSIISFLAMKLFLVGIVITIFGLFFVKVILNNVYHFNIELLQLLLCGLFIIPIYYYLPIIYLLFKLDKQNIIVGINIAAILINLILNIAFIKLYGITGAIISIGITQWILLLIYFYFKLATTKTILAST